MGGWDGIVGLVGLRSLSSSDRTYGEGETEAGRVTPIGEAFERLRAELDFGDD
jgi:hypothetical protein